MKSETKLEVTFTRTLTHEFIDDETGEYVKSTCTEYGRFRFFLRPFKEWFYPCEKCQKKLYQKTYGADSLYLGNKSYEPAIELSRDWVVNDDTWKELERKPGTLENYKKVYGYKGQEHWDQLQEHKRRQWKDPDQ